MKHSRDSFLGNRIEHNVVESLRMAGARLKTSADLDHNHKIDFLLKFKGEDVGIQFSLNSHDSKKAIAAKSCALDVVTRFIYLSIPMDFFNRPDRRNGRDLYRTLKDIVRNYSSEALSVNIDHHGLTIQPI